MILFSPLQLGFLEYNLTGEFTYRKNGFGVHLGYRPAYKKEDELIKEEWFERLWESYRALNYINLLQNNFTVGTFYKIYLGRRYVFHLKTELFYRHWWFTKKNTEYEDHVRHNAQGYQFKGLRSESQDVYGLKFTWGGSFQVKSKKMVDFIVEPFIGFGFRYRTFLYETWDGEFWGEEIDYNLEEGYDMFPTFHYGVNFGFGRFIR